MLRIKAWRRAVSLSRGKKLNGVKMLKKLKQLFIKDYEDTENSKVRLRYGIIAGIFGIISNFVLFVLKITVGLIASSITIIADAINNLSDIGTSAVTVFGFKMSSRPADPEHPYGHARYEHITALIIAIIVMLIGVMLAKESISKIINPSMVKVDIFTYIVLALAVFIKLVQMLLYKNFAAAINSDALRAASIDSRNDIISTSTVIIAVILIALFPEIKVSIDGIMGLLVSLFIIFSSIMLIKDAINPLLGVKPDKELVNDIKQKLLSYQGVLGIHDLMIHSYGVGTMFAVVHIEVSSKEDVMVSHDLMDIIERDFKEQLDISLCIHMDPVETDNQYVDELRAKVQTALGELDGKLKLHDFRLVIGKTHINILFDVDVPYGLNLSKKSIEEACRRHIKCDKKSYYVINIDIEYDIE